MFIEHKLPKILPAPEERNPASTSRNIALLWTASVGFIAMSTNIRLLWSRPIVSTIARNIAIRLPLLQPWLAIS